MAQQMCQPKNMRLIILGVGRRETSKYVFGANNMFLVLIKVDSGTAQRIAQSLQMFFTEVGLTNWISKLVVLGADGASVNMGESGGVGAMFLVLIICFWC